METFRESAECDVVVVGAGPTGLSIASLLAARGVRVLVLERRTDTSDEPKAISLDDESLRTFQQAGLADDVMRVISPGLGTVYYGADGQRLFHAGAAIPYRLGYPFKNPFAQPDLERVLADSLRRMPGSQLRFGTEVSALAQTDSGVRVEAVGPFGPLEVRARFAIGADGGRSTVRSILRIPMQGKSYDTVWLVVDTTSDPHRERYGMHHGDPARPVVIVPGLNGRCRYEFLLHDGECASGAEPSFDLISMLLAPFRRVQPGDVERAVAYTFHGLSATSWRAGRVFLIGDAAHMMPPFAGQGLNSGIRDAANLGWKIAGVIDGTLSDAVLDTYELERRPHAEATIRLSERLGRVVMTTSRRLAEWRDRLVRTALETDDGRRFFEQMQFRPRAHLTTGLLHVTDDPDLVGVQVGQPRAFDSTSHEVIMLDRALGDGWAIIGVGIPAASWALVDDLSTMLGAPTIPIDVDDTMPLYGPGSTPLIDVDGGLTCEFLGHAGRFVLLRPDRMVAASWRPDDTAAVQASIAAWMSRSPVTSPDGR